MRNVSTQRIAAAIPPGDCVGCGFVSWCLPANLSAAEVQQIERATLHRRSLKRDDHLFHAGAALHSLFVVNSGSVKTSMPDKGGRAQLIGFAMPGDIIGMEAIGSGKYPSDVIALEDTSCCGINYADFTRMSQSIRGLQQHFHRALSREITRDYDLMFMLGSMSAAERLAAFLLNISRRYSVRGYSASHFRLSMTRQDIGSYLGLKLETISRILARFNDEKILDVRGRDITVRDPACLQQIVGGSRQRVPLPRKDTSVMH